MTQPSSIEQLLNLADRAERGPLTGDEAARLRDGLDQLHREVDTLRAVCRSNKRAYVGAVKDAMAATQRAERAEAALASLHEGEEPIGTTPVAAASPAQWIWLWNRATPAERLALAGRVIDSAREAAACFQEDHRASVERAEAAAVLLADEVTRLAAILGTVRATCDRLHNLARAAHGEPSNDYERGIDKTVSVVRADLDEHQEQQT